MKRALSLLLILGLLFSIFPFNVLAFEDRPLSAEEHFALACEVFPEYADMICSPVSTTTHSTYSQPLTQRTIVLCETRDISETSKMMLVEYSDGTTLVGQAKGKVTREQISGSGVALYVVDLLVTVEGSSQQLIVTNARFTINYNEYDFVTSAGNWNTSTAVSTDGRILRERQTSLTDLARIQYSAEFQMDDESLPVTPGIDLYVGNNTYTFTAN